MVVHAYGVSGMRTISRLLGCNFSPTTTKMVPKKGLEKVRLGLVNQGPMVVTGVLDSKVASTMQYEQTLFKKLRDNLMDLLLAFVLSGGLKVRPRSCLSLTQTHSWWPLGLRG